MMNKVLFAGVGAVAAVSGALAVSAYRYEPKVRPNTFVGPVPVGGLAREEAEKRLRIWWFNEKTNKLSFSSPSFGDQKLERKASELVALDDKASIAQIPLEGFWESAGDLLTRGEPEKASFTLVFREIEGQKSLAKVFDQMVEGRKPAKVFWSGGSIRRVAESPTVTVDMDLFGKAVSDALLGDRQVVVPVKQAEKHVPDSELEKITEVMAEFSTRFPQSNRPRNTNIRAASEKIDGLVLMPGDRFSFNNVVGKRTIDNGFKEAGVYVNGRHDTGVGGGICQVSTTLYNAALFANLKIVRRTNHSMPVAYVPIGRDATVNYPSLDLVLENSTEGPIAISYTMAPGKLTYRILGKKDKSLSVKITADGHKSWDVGVKKVNDSSVAAGKQVVREKGSRGHSVRTYRLVYRDGQLEKKESLGQSHYRGGVRIVAVGPAAVAETEPKTTEPVSDPADFDEFSDELE